MEKRRKVWGTKLLLAFGCFICGILISRYDVQAGYVGDNWYYDGGNLYYCDENGDIDYDFVGVVKGAHGSLVYVKNGMFDSTYRGIACYGDAKVFISKGYLVDYYKGLVAHDETLNPEVSDNYTADDTSYWYVENGYVRDDYTGGMYFNWSDIWGGSSFDFESINPTKTFYINHGVWDRTFNGATSRTNEYGTTYYVMKNGILDLDYTGFHSDAPGFYFRSGMASGNFTGLQDVSIDTNVYYYFMNGKVYDYTGLIYDKSANKWYYLKNGWWDYFEETLAKYNGSWWYVKGGVVDFSYTGVYKYNGTWWYIKNGQLRYDYAGLAKNNTGWWYVKNGQIDWSYSGLVKYNGNWWYVKNGQVRFDYTGLVKNSAGWFHVINGQVKFGYTGLSKYDNNWWYMKNGTIQFSYTGLLKYNGTWKYIKNGLVDTSYTGLVKYNGSWWYVAKGSIRFDYTGLVKNSAGWFHVKNGQVKFGYTGMTSNENGWWYMKGGKIDFSYTGLGTNSAGTWYYKNGRITFNYTGRVYVNKVLYRVQNGKAMRIYLPTSYKTAAGYSEERLLEQAYLTGNLSSFSEVDKKWIKGLFDCLDAAYCYKTDWEKEKAVYDWLCYYVEYDYATYAAHVSNKTAQMNWQSYAAAGAFGNGLAVCDGYSKAFLMAMKILGIPCERVTGTAKWSGGGHAWNRVQIGGKWYQVDVTWADEGGTDADYVTYKYFNLTDKQMKETHEYTVKDSSKACTSTEHSYEAFLKKFG